MTALGHHILLSNYIFIMFFFVVLCSTSTCLPFETKKERVRKEDLKAAVLPEVCFWKLVHSRFFVTILTRRQNRSGILSHHFLMAFKCYEQRKYLEPFQTSKMKCFAKIGND